MPSRPKRSRLPRTRLQVGPSDWAIHGPRIPPPTVIAHLLLTAISYDRVVRVEIDVGQRYLGGRARRERCDKAVAA